MKLRQMAYMIKHVRHAQKLEKVWKFVMDNTEKKCLYCNKQFGVMIDLPVEEFLLHIANEHPKEVDLKEVQNWIKLFK